MYTQYLVSVFGSSSSATAAFSHQQSAYGRLSAAYPSRYLVAGAPVKVGDRESFGYDLTRVGNRSFYTSELYFTRGRVYVEVVQSYYAADTDPYGQRAGKYLLAIAQQLDRTAGGR